MEIFSPLTNAESPPTFMTDYHDTDWTLSDMAAAVI
jgi:hypothetical protein